MEKNERLALFFKVDTLDRYSDYSSTHLLQAYVCCIRDQDTVRGICTHSLDDFRVSTYINARNPSEYRSFSAEFHSVYTVNLQRAKSIAKTLTTLYRKLDAITAKFGPCESFGAYVARVATCLGIKDVVFTVGQSRGTRYDDNDYNILSTDLAASRINSEIFQLVEAEKAQKLAA